MSPYFVKSVDVPLEIHTQLRKTFSRAKAWPPAAFFGLEAVG
jgi:hypothetical protein